jgi:uncharacterized membrane protein (UPF0127 family)
MHELENALKKKRVNADVEIADTDFSRMRGLMFREEIVPILFVFSSPGIFSIHSYFVRKEFDAIYLAADGTVTEVFRKIAPNTALVKPKRISSFLLELPVEMTDQLCIEAGDVLRWKKTGDG